MHDLESKHRRMSLSDVTKFPKVKPWQGERTRWAHRKLDGHSLRVVRNNEGVVQMHSRKPLDLTEKLMRFGFARAFWERMPRNVVLFGELVVFGKPAAYIKTAINDHDGSLRFVAFSAWSLQDDLSELTAARDFCERCGIQFAEFWKFDEKPEKLPPYTEGWVYKDGTYGEWYKEKPVRTIDLIVTGTTDGKGKYIGLLGALKCSTYCGRHVANVSGMDDATRIEASLNEPEGRVVEVSYDKVDAKGKLRFPRFVRWRPDKSPEECGIMQEPDLCVH